MIQIIITHLRMTWSASRTWLETPTCAATADGDSNLQFITSGKSVNSKKTIHIHHMIMSY